MKNKKNDPSVLPFGKMNYILLGAGLGLILLGYFLMSTEDFIDANEFSLALYVCPFLILGGLVTVGYGILKKPSAQDIVAEEQRNSQA